MPERGLPPAETLRRLTPGVERPIVAASARRHERLSGVAFGNAEEAVGEYLTRLDKLTETERGQQLMTEQLLEQLLVKQEDIPEAYWELRRQMDRKDGGNGFIDDEAKTRVTDELRDAQQYSLWRWITVFETGAEEYPTWFKVYAFEGVTNLADYNREKGRFNRRSKGTVTPYPHLHSTALRMAYENVDPAQPRSFNNLYSEALLSLNETVLTAERAEDVEGVWQTYGPDRYNELMDVSRHTGWCLSKQGFIERYAIHSDEFIMFHNTDPQTERISSTAAASIRLRNGMVAEVSGVKKEQWLEAALVPTVMDKLAGLRHGELFIKRIKHEQQLATVLHKQEKDDPLNEEEVRFILQVDHPLYTQNTEQSGKLLKEVKNDPRFKEQAADTLGRVNAKWLLRDGKVYTERFNDMIEEGVDMNLFVNVIKPFKYLEYLATIQLSATPIDIDALVCRTSPVYLLMYIERLRDHGAVIDYDAIIDECSARLVAEKARSLIAAGVTRERILRRIPPHDRFLYADELRAADITLV